MLQAPSGRSSRRTTTENLTTYERAFPWIGSSRSGTAAHADPLPDADTLRSKFLQTFGKLCGSGSEGSKLHIWGCDEKYHHKCKEQTEAVFFGSTFQKPWA